jgi:hypothetical protein
MLIAHTVLHWLVSQSFFFTLNTPYDVHGQLDKDHTRTFIEYSLATILMSMGIMVLMFCLLIALSFRKFKSGIPLAGSCSAAISAACHPPSYENLDTLALGIVMWKETERSTSGTGADHPGNLNSWNGQYSFTSADAREA